MTEARNAETEESPYVRAPWPLVTAAIVGVLLMALAAGVFANRYLRVGAGSAPTALVATPLAVATSARPAAVATISPVTPSPTSRPVAAATPTQEPAVLAAGPPTSISMTPTTPAESTPLPTPLTTITPAPTPTVDPMLAEQVAKAYETFWRVRSQALLELDPTHLDEVMGGQYLVDETELIERLRTESRAIKTQVRLNYSVVEVTGNSATVVDDFEDNSIYVKIGTEDPLTPPPSDQLRVVYTLSNSSGTWKVIDSVRPE